MEIYALLEAIKEIINNSKSVPFMADKCIVERRQITDILEEINNKMPDELKQAKWIKEERERIIAEAQKDANDIVKEAENRIIAMIDEHEITKKAYEKKDEIIADANEMYRDIKQKTNNYIDEILANIEGNLGELGKSINNVELSIQQALETIQNNRKELH